MPSAAAGIDAMEIEKENPAEEETMLLSCKEPLCCWACRGGARDPTQAQRLWGAGKALPRSAVCRVAVVGDDVRDRQALEKVFLRATRRSGIACAALGCGLGTFAQNASSR